jgi:very-short-patch-repair endonuclease
VARRARRGETDGGAAHAAPRARERDHRRDAALAVAGYRVHRFTWSQVTGEPGAVARTLRALLVHERT